MECSCNKRETFPGKAVFAENGFEHVVSFSPGFICEKWIADKNDMSNHGKGCVDLLFLVRNGAGAVQFRLLTGWYLDWRDRNSYHQPLPSGLGYHSPIPQYEGQEPITDKCLWLNEKACYYDGSSLNAEEPFDILLSQGENALWKFLEEYHRQTFGNQP